MKIYNVVLDDGGDIQFFYADNPESKKFKQQLVSRIVLENTSLQVMFLVSARCFNLPGKPMEKFIKIFDLKVV